jgi:hypothetical protein
MVTRKNTTWQQLHARFAVPAVVVMKTDSWDAVLF